MFNGKELDEETGLVYYGARYYNPRESVWLSIDPLWEQVGAQRSPYEYTYSNPVNYTDPTGMSPDDVYLDTYGNYLGEDGATTNNVRVIDRYDYEDIDEENGGTTSAEATKQLQSKSSVVSIDKSGIQQSVNDVNNETLKDQTKERQTYLVMKINKSEDIDGVPTATVTAKRGADGVDGFTTISREERRSGISTSGSDIMIGQVHSHNKLQNPSLVNIPGVSPKHDTPAAKRANITVYALDSYTGKNSVPVHRTADGVETKNVGNSTNYNFGSDALNLFVKRKLK